MSETEAELRKEIAALRAEVADLRWQASGGRLGPKTPTQEEVNRDAKAFAERLAQQIKRDTLIDVDAPPVDRSKLCTTNGKTPEEVRANQKNETGQHDGYIILCDEERAKGFVRPYRDRYTHVGRAELVGSGDSVALIGGCNSVTTMGRALSETYARDPTFYGATFCVSCNRHLPVSEFVWTVDGQQVGS